MLKEIVCAGLLLAAAATFGYAQDSNPSERIVERYRELLRANPTQGTALDRLWKIYQEKSATAELLESYRGDASFSGRMLHGHLLRKADQKEAAEAAYREAASADAENVLPHLALADLANAEGDPDAAAAEMEKACALLAEDDPTLPGALLKLGILRAAAGDSKRAAEAWERTVALDPANMQLRIQLAQSYESNDLPERAVTHYEFIVANGSAYERALAFRDLARVRQVLGDEDGAIAALEQGIALTAPGNWLREALQWQLIRLHQRYGRTEELEEKWRAAVARNPRDLGGYLQLVALYRQLADPPRQREWLERLVELAPRNLEYKELLARLLTQLGDADAAAALYDAILAARPDDADAEFSRAVLDVRQGSIRKAQDRVEALIAAHPDDDSVHQKALGFYAQHRLYDTLERHLHADGPIALAQFYFDRDRGDKARAALELLIDPAAAPEEQAAASQRIAGIYRERNDLPRAIVAMERAAKLQPESFEIALALGNLYLMRAAESADELGKAKETVERAYSLAGDAAAREEADRTLFQVFQSAVPRKSTDRAERSAAKSAPLLDAKGRINLFAMPLPTGPGRRRTENRELAEYIEGLARDAEATSSAQAWLRVAQWQIWARRTDLAMQAVSEALELDPGLIAGRVMVVKIASANGLPEVAASQLRDLVRLDPGNATRYRKQLADLRLAVGDSVGALAIFRELADANPGDAERLADLALALQQNGDWDAALATWRKAYAVSAPTERGSVLSPLLRLLDRLGRSQEALGLLLESVDAQKDETLRFDALRETLSYAASHGLVERLREDFEARHRRRPNDYFTEMALAQILKAEGRNERSFELQRAAAYSAPDPVSAFEELASEAEALGKIDAAIETQQRLIALRSDESPEALENLAALQERALDIQAAASTWRSLVARFPRDPEILRRAAEFFALWRFDDEASGALRSARVLEPRDLRGLLQLADLAQRSGREAEALSCYDQILRLAQPEPEREREGEIVVPSVPDADRPGLRQAYLAALRSRSGVVNTQTLRVMNDFWKGGTEQPLTDTGYRLAAIRGAATILAGEEFELERVGWLREWDRNRAATPSERLWAFYFAGDRDRTMDLLAERMRAEPENPYTKQAFIWLALQMKGYEALGRWLGESERQPQDRDLMAIALGQYLSSNPGALDPALVPTVFPPDYQLRQMTWQAAALLANAGHFGEATRLGERVFAEAVSSRATFGNELAFWYLVLGDTKNARRVLKDSIADQTGDAPDAAVFEALRRYVLLLPADRRDAFIAEYTADPAHNAEPMHRAISRVLLFGLARDEERAAEALRDLYALHGLSYADDYDGSATYRAWSFVLAMGIQLQKWRLDGLAGALWRQALSDPALAHLAGRQTADIVRDLKVRLAANDLVTRTPTEGRVGLADFLAGSGDALAPALAAVLESSGYPQFSIRIYREIWERDPSALNHLRGLLDACRSANAAGVATETLIDSMENAIATSKPTIYREAVLQFIDFLIGQEEYEHAGRLLAAAENYLPQDPMLLERQARVAKQRGDAGEAERVYRELLAMLPSNTQTRLLLAGVLDEQGKTSDAIALLEAAPPGGASQNFDAPLADLYLKDGKIDRARAAVGKLMRGNQFDAIPGLAESLAAQGHRREAQRILYSIVQRFRADGEAFPWQMKFLETLSPQEEPDLFARALDQLREMVRDTPELLPTYYEARLQLARTWDSLDAWKDELVREWADGAGPYAAGAALVELEVSTDAPSSPQLEGTVAQLLAHPGFDRALLSGLRTRLADAGRLGLAAKVAGALADRMPLQTELVIDHARALSAAGETLEATGEFEQLARRAIVEPELCGLVGEELRKLGSTDAAQRVFEQAVRLDPYAVHYDSYVHYARLLIEENDLDRARRVLRYAFRNPANADVEAIVDLLAAENALRDADRGITDFQLSPSNLRSFQRAVTTRAAPAHTE